MEHDRGKGRLVRDVFERLRHLPLGVRAVRADASGDERGGAVVRIREGGAFVKGKDAPMRLAVGFGSRVRGLLGTKRSKGVVMLAPCNDVHTFGMAELIDIAFLDERGQVLESYRAVGPRRRIRCRKAVAVLERFSVNDPPWFSAGEHVEMTRKDGAGK